MKFEQSTLVSTQARGVRLVALQYLDDAEAAGSTLAESHDPEALHDFRVAVRRLRSWLRAFADDLNGVVRKKDLRRLRDIARATNLGRDIDVQVAWLRETAKHSRGKRRAGAQWLADHLAARQRAAGDPVDAALLRNFRRVRDDLSDKLATVEEPVRMVDDSPPPTLAQGIALRIPPHVEALASALALVHTVHDESQAHEARIRAKRVRYLIEPGATFAKGGDDVLARLKSMQDELGALHDAHVLGHEVNEAGLLLTAPRDELEALADRITQEAEARFDRVRKDWLGDGFVEFVHDVADFTRRLGDMHA